jgi:hypothetical protein
MQSERIEETNNVYTKLTVLGYSHTSSNGKAYWNCQCSCGSTVKQIQGSNLRSGAVKSCGCIAVELSSERCTRRNRRADARRQGATKCFK